MRTNSVNRLPVVTLQMLEVLRIAFVYPYAYIRIRKEEFRKDYLPILTAAQVREAFLIRIGELPFEQASPAGRHCYCHFSKKYLAA